MIYVIAAPCVDVRDRSCVEVCPADCIYEGDRTLYINPEECIGCGVCEAVCPVEAIYREDELPPGWRPHLDDNAAFFRSSLSGRSDPLGNPGGAAEVGRIGADTELVRGLPPLGAPVAEARHVAS